MLWPGDYPATILRCNRDPMILTTDQSLINNREYQQISATIFRLSQSGVIHMGQGWCVSMSDMIYTLLKQQGIISRLVECQATITAYDQNQLVKVNTVGVDMALIDGAVSTHVVLVTVTDPPMIIDASIGGLLPQGYSVLIDSAEIGHRADRIFCSIDQPDFKITYQEKLTPKVPFTHQTSVIDRIVTDQKIFSDIRLLQRLNYIGIALSMFAVINVIGKMLDRL